MNSNPLYSSNAIARRFPFASITVLAAALGCGSLALESPAADDTIYFPWSGSGSSLKKTIKVRFKQPGDSYSVEVKAVPPEGGSGEFVFKNDFTYQNDKDHKAPNPDDFEVKGRTGVAGLSTATITFQYVGNGQQKEATFTLANEIVPKGEGGGPGDPMKVALETFLKLIWMQFEREDKEPITKLYMGAGMTTNIWGRLVFGNLDVKHPTPIAGTLELSVPETVGTATPTSDTTQDGRVKFTITAGEKWADKETITLKNTGVTDDSKPATLMALDTNLVTSVVQLELKQVGFSGSGYQKHVKDIKDTYANETGDDIHTPEWAAGATNAICYVQGSSPILHPQFNIHPDLQNEQLVAKLKVEATEEGFGTLKYEKDVKLTGNSLTIDQLTTSDKLTDRIANTWFKHDWKISWDGGTQYSTITNSPPNQIFVIWGEPAEKIKIVGRTVGGETQANVLTYKRLNYLCAQVTGQEDVSVIARGIGRDATASYRFKEDGPSVIGDKATVTAWAPLDGTRCDCGTVANLMRVCLEQLDVKGSDVYYVYPVTYAWNGLTNISPWADRVGEHRRKPKPNVLLKICPMLAKPSLYEGCCVYDGKWWMAGEGAFYRQPVHVLTYFTWPNNRGDTPHQAWEDKLDEPVGWPNPQPNGPPLPE